MVKTALAVALAGTVLAAIRVGYLMAGATAPAWIDWACLALWLAAAALAARCAMRASGRHPEADANPQPRPGAAMTGPRDTWT